MNKSGIPYFSYPKIGKYLRHTAYVVGVRVSRDQKIYLFYIKAFEFPDQLFTGIFGACVDKDGFTPREDEKRGIALSDIESVIPEHPVPDRSFIAAQPGCS